MHEKHMLAMQPMSTKSSTNPINDKTKASAHVHVTSQKDGQQQDPK
jgi:hypothetical protein